MQNDETKMRECLEGLRDWFDTDAEVLAAMDADTLADHKRQVARIDTALAPTTQGTDSGLADEFESAMKVVADEIGALKGNRIKDNDERRARRLRRFERALSVGERVHAALRIRTDRKAVLEEAAKVAESHPDAWKDTANMGPKIAKEIRARAEGAGK